MDREMRAKIVHAFFQTWRDSRDKTSRFEETVKGSYRMLVERDKPTILIGPEGITALNKVVNLLRENSAIRSIFSHRELVKRVQSIATALYSVEPSEIDVRVNSYVDEMLQQLQAAIPVEWRVYIPVENLRVSSELVIGQTSIRMFDELTKQSILTSFVEINSRIKSPGVKAQSEEIFRERLTPDYDGKAVALVKTKAVDTARVIESAIEKAETVLNVLRFYSRGVIRNDARAYRMYIGLKGTVSTGRTYGVAFRGSDEYTMSTENTGYLYELELGEKEISSMRRDSFKRLHEILSKEIDQRTAFENLIINSVNLFGRAMNNPDTVNAFVSIVVALESVLLKKGEPMKTLLAERVALLLGESFEERMFYFNQMSRLYQIRNDIVHRGFVDVTESDLALLSLFAYRVLVRLISDSSRVNDIGKLVEEFNVLKFGSATKPES